MIWLVAIVLIFYHTFKELIADQPPNGFLEWAFIIFAATFFSILISLVPIGIAFFIGSIPKRKAVLFKKYDLITLRERGGISGSFFLGTGMINNTEYYFWYRRDEDGSIRGGKTERSEDVQIFDTDNKPQMIEWKCEYESKYVIYYMWLIGVDKTGEDDYQPQFFIPKGSIKEGYTL